MSQRARRVIGIVMALALGLVAQHLAHSAAPEPVFTVTYATTDLPVFRLVEGQPKFDPTLLISHIKATIDPPTWKEGEGTIAVFEKNQSLVVAQTGTNHKNVAHLLASMRQAP